VPLFTLRSRITHHSQQGSRIQADWKTLLNVIGLSVAFPQTPPDGTNSLGCSHMEMDTVALKHKVDLRLRS